MSGAVGPRRVEYMQYGAVPSRGGGGVQQQKWQTEVALSLFKTEPRVSITNKALRLPVKAHAVLAEVLFVIHFILPSSFLSSHTLSGVLKGTRSTIVSREISCRRHRASTRYITSKRDTLPSMTPDQGCPFPTSLAYSFALREHFTRQEKMLHRNYRTDH